MHFGEHLTIDGYGGSFEKLEDRGLILKVLKDLPKQLGMLTISPPVVLRYAGNAIKDPGGWSGYVMIAESHISIHTFSKRGFLTADVYTCKNGLDVKTVQNYFREQFDLQKLEINFIKRGLKYPKNNIYS